MSNKYKANYPNKWKALQNNKNKNHIIYNISTKKAP